MNHIFCTDAIPQFLNLFDFSVAPTLLYYSYIPIILATFILSFYVLKKDKYSLKSKLLFFTSLSFIFWVLNILIQWTVVMADIVMFSWQITALFEILIPLIIIYFVYVYINKKDFSFKIKILISLIYLTVVVLTPTTYNVQSFDLTYCEGQNGFLLIGIYLFELITGLLISGWGLFYNKNAKSDDKKQNKFIALGAGLFLVIFSLSNIFGEVLQTYSINLVGPIGMVIFLGLLVYMIVKFKAFNVKLLAAQALMFTLIALIASQLFFIRSQINFMLTGFTLSLSVVFGGLLIRNVKREIEHREEIQRLAVQLSNSNEELSRANEKLKELDKQKTEFVSLASHQLRSPITAIKGYSSMILEGSFGKVNEKIKDAVGRIFQSSQKLVLVIEDFLNITRIELGRMKYDISEFSFNTLINNVIGEQKPNIERRGLQVTYEEDKKDYKVFGDMGKISQVISNLIDNAVKYSKEGTIRVKVSGNKGEDKKDKVRFSVSDNGVGIEPQVMPNLFNKFTRAYDASKTNIIGTGLGLYVAKQIVDAHQGRIWAESEGKGKGATFLVEFNVSTGVAPIMVEPPAEDNTPIAPETQTATPDSTTSAEEAHTPQPTTGDLS